MTLVYFTLSSFDLLDSFDQMRTWSREKLIENIYSYQIDADDSAEVGKWGFRSSFSNGAGNRYDCSHITLTYCGLCSLIILKDDLKRVDRANIIRGLREYQKKSGCFFSSPGGESDLRFIYCAAAICYILNDFSSIDIDQMVRFIMNSMVSERRDLHFFEDQKNLIRI